MSLGISGYIHCTQLVIKEKKRMIRPCTIAIFGLISTSATYSHRILEVVAHVFTLQIDQFSRSGVLVLVDRLIIMIQLAQVKALRNVDNSTVLFINIFCRHHDLPSSDFT